MNATGTDESKRRRPMISRESVVAVHRWSGLVIAAFIALCGLTGAVLAFEDELFAALNPELAQLDWRGGRAAADTIAARVEAEEARIQVTFVTLQALTGATLPVYFVARTDLRTARPFELEFNQLYVDPTSGAIVGKADTRGCCTRQSIVATLHRFHESLLGGDPGKKILGCVALVWLVSSVLGFYLTLPRGGNFLRRWWMAWRIEPRAGTLRLNFDLHRASGLWLWGVFILIAISSVYFNLRPVFDGAIGVISGYSTSPLARQPGTDVAIVPGKSFDAAVSIATQAAQERGWTAPIYDVGYFSAPRAYRLSFGSHQPSGLGFQQLFLDADTGAVLGVREPGRGTPADVLAQAQFPIHSGQIAGLAGRVVIAFAGLAAAALAFTGVYLWWKRRPFRTIARKRAMQATAALWSIAIVGALISGAPAQARERGVDARVRDFERSLQPAVQIAGAPEVRWTLSERMQHWRVPAVSVAVIRDGKLSWARAYGVSQVGTRARADDQTMFAVGSISKLANAALVLKLVQSGQLDLDRDVNDYLRRWKVPSNRYTAARPATLRGILSHTAGFNVHGFPDFAPADPLPTIVETLQGVAPARSEPIRVMHFPGTARDYSGGGVMVAQLAIEDALAQPYADVAARYLFEPLRMTRSTFLDPVAASLTNIAKAHDEAGQPAALPRGYESKPELAAAGLWTTASDGARLIVELIDAYRGSQASYLSPDTVHMMMREVGPSLNGLGPKLAGRGATRRFFHDGSTDSYQAWLEGHLYSGSGVVILTNGANGRSLYQEARRAIAAAEGWADELRDTRFVPDVQATVAALDQLVGEYRVEAASSYSQRRQSPTDSSYRVQRSGSALEVVAAAEGEQRRMELVPEDDSHFISDDGQTRFEIVRDHDDRVAALVVGRGEYTREATKTSPGKIYDLLLENGRVIDGSGNPWYAADVGIRDGRIAAVGDLDAASTRERIDVRNQVIAPGFIDLHSHADDAWGAKMGLRSADVRRRQALNFLTQGVTTTVVNPDGFADVGLSIGGQHAALERLGFGPNVALMVGHNAIRSAVMQDDVKRAATGAEIAAMRALVRKGMQEGAFGLTSGLEYSPGQWSNAAEVAALMEEVAPFDGVHMSHLRSETYAPMWWVPSQHRETPAQLLDAVQEIIGIAEHTRTKAVCSHIKVRGSTHWGQSRNVIELIEAARARGVEVYADQYPYDSSGTDGYIIFIPAWALGIGKTGSDLNEEVSYLDFVTVDADLPAALRKTLADEKLRTTLLKDIEYAIAFRGGADRVVVLDYPDPSFVGQTLGQLARKRGVTAAQMVIALQLEGHPRRLGGVQLRSFSLHEQDIEALMARSWVATSSDADIRIPEDGPMHARNYGAFPRKLARYVRERGTIGLEFAVRSATSLPAQILGLKDRGRIVEGGVADLVVFDPQTIQDQATFENPYRFATGIDFVLVNGVPVVRGGQPTHALPGAVLTHPSRVDSAPAAELQE